MEKTFYLLVTVQHLGADRTCIEGRMNYDAGSKLDLEVLREAMYKQMANNLEYFVLYDMESSAETWIPGEILKNSVVTFRIVSNPSFRRKQ
jgi:hypothetical protein